MYLIFEIQEAQNGTVATLPPVQNETREQAEDLPALG